MLFWFQFDKFSDQKLINKFQGATQLVHRIDLSTILNKSYKSFFEFRQDIAWFSHNCRILFPHNVQIRDLSEYLIKYVDEEIFSVEKCIECYSNASEFPDDSFVMPCDPPHPIIWAKFERFNFWPAKLMSMDGEMVHVRFFGDHTNANVSTECCYQYSRDPPIQVTPMHRYMTKEYNLALKVSSTYINNNCPMTNKFYFRVCELGSRNIYTKTYRSWSELRVCSTRNTIECHRSE